MKRDAFFDIRSKVKLEALILGVDLGQTHDYTAISTLEKYQTFKAWPYENERDGKPVYHCRFLERPPLGTSYTAIVRRVAEIYQNLINQFEEKPVLVIDRTGCGRPVFDMFKDICLRPVGISIHGGNNVSEGDSRHYSVPKRDIVGFLQALNQSDHLMVSPELALRDVFIHELLNMRVKVNINTAHDSYEAWRESDHDDLVLSVGCGAWYGKYLDRKAGTFPRLPGL